MELVEPVWLEAQLEHVQKQYIRLVSTLAGQKDNWGDSRMYEPKLLECHARENLKKARISHDNGMAQDCVTYLTKTTHNLNMLHQAMGLSLQKVWKQRFG